MSIVQRYLYGERNLTTGNGRSLGVGAEGTLETGVTATGRTDRSGSASVTIAEQQTRLERLATFAGVTRVQRGLKLSIEVVHDPSPAPTSGRARRALQRIDGPSDRGGPVRTKTAELRGELTQLIPSGFLGPQVEESAGRSVPALPSAYFVDSVGREDGQHLLAAVRAGVVKVLGESAARLHQAELESQLSASALNANFSMMATPEGHRVIRLESAGQGRDAVDVIIRAVPVDATPVSPVVAGAELGEVNRSQHTVSSTVSSGRLLPAAGGATITAPGEVRTTVSFGEQLSDQTTDVRGVRRERTRSEDGSLVTVRLGVRYHIELAPVTVLGLVRTDGPERRGDRIELVPVPGVVYVTGHRYQLSPEEETE